MRPFIIGVAGGTASGKTTLTSLAAARLDALVLTHDRYYLDAPDPSLHDFDHPYALETPLLCAHLAALREGRAAEVPVYDFATHSRLPRTDRIEPREVLFVEGILVMADPALRAAFDFTVYVHADDDVRLARRIRRDTAERGRTWDDVLRQWFHTVRPAHKRWVAPASETADLVLDGERAIDGEVNRLVHAIEAARAVRAF